VLSLGITLRSHHCPRRLPLIGDWLTDHVPFRDEVTDFYDSLFSAMTSSSLTPRIAPQIG
jgi:hypothetical protein